MISGQRALLERFPATRAVFLPGGQALGPGAMLKQPDLADTLDQIARESSTAFYQGSIAKRIGDFLGGNGGVLTAEDFSDHEAWVGAPLQSTYRGKTVYQTGLPTQGFVQLEAQNILEGFDHVRHWHRFALGVHLMVESLKRAFHDRHLYAGDPNVVDVPMDKLLSPEWAAERRATIDPNQALLDTKSTYLYPSDTTYLCAIDGEGLMISLIISISGVWGSGVIAGDTGVLLNNRGGHCFTLDPDHPNCYAPGKKTMHTLNCYLIAEADGTPLIVGGTPGGDSQPQWNLQWSPPSSTRARMSRRRPKFPAGRSGRGRTRPMSAPVQAGSGRPDRAGHDRWAARARSRCDHLRSLGSKRHRNGHRPRSGHRRPRRRLRSRAAEGIAAGI